jgi:hypothetical protein
VASADLARGCGARWLSRSSGRFVLAKATVSTTMWWRVGRRRCSLMQVDGARASGLAEGLLVTELSAYEFSTLRDGALTLSRGLGEGLTPILLVAPTDDYPSRDCPRHPR